MRNQMKTHEPIRKNGQIVKKSQKHETNLQKNSTLYFQIGLIVCLMAAYGLLEMKFESKVSDYGSLPPIEDPVYVDVPLIKTKVQELVEPIKQKQKPSHTFKEVIDETPELPFLDEFKETIVNAPDINPRDIDPVEEIPEENFVDFISIEEVPIYPGCENEKTRDDKSKCMSDKISKLIQRKFDVDLASELGLSGKQKIDVQFKIDKAGFITEIKTRAPHPKLKYEAERVIELIPNMQPGKQRNKPVGVRYYLPIIFQVQN